MKTGQNLKQFRRGQKVCYFSYPYYSRGKIIFKLFNQIIIWDWKNKPILFNHNWWLEDLQEAIKDNEETIKKYANAANGNSALEYSALIMAKGRIKENREYLSREN